MSGVLIVGDGGREHAIGDNMLLDPEVDKVVYIPGNAGTGGSNSKNAAINLNNERNWPLLTNILSDENIGLTIIGPEKFIAAGLADYLRSRGNIVFAPSKEASVLETDKFYSFRLMMRLGIPQAASYYCDNQESAKKIIKKNAFSKSDRGIVLKARGLTGGKGVRVYDSIDEALDDVSDFYRSFGNEVLVSERLFGHEFSVFGISDGTRVLPLEVAVQDHKRLLDHDKGPNTGGMGAFAPVSFVTPQLINIINEQIMNKVVREMKKEGREYRGFIYAGMMLTEDGLKVLEFNCRMGDPECQALMPLMEESLYKTLVMAANGQLGPDSQIPLRDYSSCCVVLTVPGYPDSEKVKAKVRERELMISGIEKASNIEGVRIYHAGTEKLDDGTVIAVRGRALNVVGSSSNGLQDAKNRAYEAARLITMPGGFHYRTDIGSKFGGLGL